MDISTLKVIARRHGQGVGVGLEMILLFMFLRRRRLVDICLDFFTPKTSLVFTTEPNIIMAGLTYPGTREELAVVQ